MTAFVFAILRVGGLKSGNHTSVWTFGKAATAHRRACTGTC